MLVLNMEAHYLHRTMYDTLKFRLAFTTKNKTTEINANTDNNTENLVS